MLSAAVLMVVTGLSPMEALGEMLQGEPVPSAQDPAAMEFGDAFLLPESPELFDEAILRQLHLMAFGSRPDGLQELSEAVAVSWDDLDTGTRNLWRELAGRAGLSVPREDPSPENLTALLRYASESGTPPPDVDPGLLTPLQRYYLVLTLPPDEAEEFIDDPCWSVRTAVISVNPNSAFRMLDDPSPAVRLQAALTSGRSDLLLEMAFMPGPVGQKALAGIGQVPILEDFLYRDQDPAVRAAALLALLDLGWTIPDERLDYLLTDDYLMVRAIAADASGRDFAMPDEGPPENLPPIGEVPDAVVLSTTEGDFEMELLKAAAPTACRSFWHLAESGFYDGIYFHRVIPGFVAQAGCPQGNGFGGPGYVLPAEHNTEPFTRGAVGMADSGPGTGGSQFFIMLDSHRRLDCRYTAFGRLVDASMADMIETGTRILEIAPANAYELAGAAH